MVGVKWENKIPVCLWHWKLFSLDCSLLSKQEPCLHSGFLTTTQTVCLRGRTNEFPFPQSARWPRAVFHDALPPPVNHRQECTSCCSRSFLHKNKQTLSPLTKHRSRTRGPKTLHVLCVVDVLSVQDAVIFHLCVNCVRTSACGDPLIWAQTITWHNLLDLSPAQFPFKEQMMQLWLLAWSKYKNSLFIVY